MVAILAGFGYYVLIRAVAAFPSYLIYTVPMAIGVFVAIAILGYFVSGNVPDNDRDRQQYFKRFQSPTVTGLGLAMAGLIIDFLIHVAAAAVNALIVA